MDTRWPYGLKCQRSLTDRHGLSFVWLCFQRQESGPRGVFPPARLSCCSRAMDSGTNAPDTLTEFPWPPPCRTQSCWGSLTPRTHPFDCLHHFLNVGVVNFFLQPLKKIIKPCKIQLFSFHKTHLSVLISAILINRCVTFPYCPATGRSCCNFRKDK